MPELNDALARIDQFADGNGRLARLIANLPLLIMQNKRHEYITLLAGYQTHISPPNLSSVAEYGFSRIKTHSLVLLSFVMVVIRRRWL